MTTQEDREAAASGYFAWCSGNPVIPSKMRKGLADDHSMIQAFACHRIAAEQRIVAWLREDAGKTADELRRLHRGQKLTPAMTLEWEALIRLKAGIAQAIEAGDHLPN